MREDSGREVRNAKDVRSGEGQGRVRPAPFSFQESDYGEISYGGSSKKNRRYLGFRPGLTAAALREILEGNPAVDWFEIISENYMVPGGRPLAMLEKIRARYPIVMHGVSLSIASTAPLDLDYLGELKKLIARVEPKWVSDHLCWTGVHGFNLHDLLAGSLYA